MKLEQAQAIVQTVVAEAPAPVSVFVADGGGELVAAATMDGAAPDTRLNAQRKAYTAARSDAVSTEALAEKAGSKGPPSSRASTPSSRSSSAASPRSRATGGSAQSASAGSPAPTTTRWRGRRWPTPGWRRDEARPDVDREHQRGAARRRAGRGRDRGRRQPRRRRVRRPTRASTESGAHTGATRSCSPTTSSTSAAWHRRHVDRALVTYADGHGMSLWDAMGHVEEAGLASASAKAVTQFRNVMQSLMATATDATSRRSSRRCSTAAATSSRSRPSARSRRADASRTSKSSSASRASTTLRREERSLSGFLQEISLYSDQDALRNDEDDGGQVTLMTLHNAKGLEFRAVFMIGMEEGIFPHARSIEENSLEEERRLCYVGMTRAKERLTLTHAMRRNLYGRSDANLPSRFLDELPTIGVERERLRPASWSDYGARRRASTRRATDIPDLSTGDTVRHQHARHRDRHAHRAGQRRHRALRGRERAAADARVRAARAVRVERMDIEVRACSSVEELRDALNVISHYFGHENAARGRRALRASGSRSSACTRRSTATGSSAARARSRSGCRCPAARRSRPRGSPSSACCRRTAAAAC